MRATAAGIVLAGGRSTRMGRPKAALEWHGSTLLQRVVGIVGRVVDGPVVVVRAPGQQLPALPPGAAIATDAREGRGPLQGLAAGLEAVGDGAERAYVSSTDVPLLHPAFVRRVLRVAELEGADVALPVAHGFRHPLAAAYRTALLPTVERLIAEDRMKPAFLFEEAQVHQLDEDELLRDRELAEADPELLSLSNLNDPDDYDRARSRSAPAVTVRCFGALARNGGGHEPVPVHAATLAAAAAATGVALDRHVVAALNGDQISRNPEYPLAAGDAVAFLAADAGG
ncbi:MAG: NTP transferase domain-containing protein [Thermoleophilaceae bacterium]